MGQLVSRNIEIESVVTRAEFDRWASEQRSVIIEYTQQETQKLVARVAELERENQTLRTINESLESQRLNPPTSSNSSEHPIDLLGPESQQVIDKFVEELLQDPTINISYFPDVVERQIYRNVFHLLVGLLNRVITQSSIDLLGHSITLKMKPQKIN